MNGAFNHTHEYAAQPSLLGLAFLLLSQHVFKYNAVYSPCSNNSTAMYYFTGFGEVMALDDRRVSFYKLGLYSRSERLGYGSLLCGFFSVHSPLID